MKNKRLIGVVTVRNGWAVQSFGYKRYLPLGRPEILVENLDRWGVDEILLNCIDRHGLGPDWAVIDRLNRIGVTTALTYAGGITSANEAVKVIAAGADRIAIDAALLDDPKIATSVAHQIGAQAVIASVPVKIQSGRLMRFDYRTGLDQVGFSDEFRTVCETGDISELILVDVNADGGPGIFNTTLLDAVAIPKIPIIAFGGISTSQIARSVLGHERVSAIAIGNFLNYQEHSVQKLKKDLDELNIRPRHYQSYTAGLPFHVTKL